MELSDEMKALLKDLGMALHQALTKDDQVKLITDEIKDSGFDIYLIMEASIALDKTSDDKEGRVFFNAKDEIDPKFNAYDADFLAEMKIRLDG